MATLTKRRAATRAPLPATSLAALALKVQGFVEQIDELVAELTASDCDLANLMAMRAQLSCARHATDLTRQSLEAVLMVRRQLGAVAKANTSSGGPECGHSACRQNWIESGETECVGSLMLTDADRVQADEAANRG